LAIAQPASALESKIAEEMNAKAKVAFQIETDIRTMNVFRGVAYLERPVLQPTIDLSYKGFNINLWSNIDIKNTQLNEFDFTFGFAKQLGKCLSLSTGYTLYTYPNTCVSKTQEVYVNAGFELQKIVNPSLLIALDFDEGKGAYVKLSADHSFRIFSTSVAVCYNHHYFRENSGFAYAEIILAIPLSKKQIFAPVIIYQKSLDKRDFKDILYGGLHINFN
jgi:uncharacterized protein (TIGR02001 family)